MSPTHWRWKTSAADSLPAGRWLQVTASETELGPIEVIPVARYGYRGKQISVPGLQNQPDGRNRARYDAGRSFCGQAALDMPMICTEMMLRTPGRSA